MTPEELYQKEFGESKQVSKEAVIRLLRHFAKVLNEEREEKPVKVDNILKNIPKSCFCECKEPIRITTVVPLPDICEYCKKVLKS